jgi:hypothetical protein
VVPPASHKLTGVRGTQASDALLPPTCTGLSPPPVPLSNGFQSGAFALMSDPTTPHIRKECEVWAPPVSLATTAGISFDFFSSGY